MTSSPSPKGRVRLHRDRLSSEVDELRKKLPLLRSKYGADNARVVRVEGLLQLLGGIVEAVDHLVPAAATTRSH